MTDYQAELNAANKAFNVYLNSVKELNEDYEREMELAEQYYGDDPFLLQQEKNRIASSKRYKGHVIKMGELIQTIKMAEAAVKQTSVIIETQDPLWWAMLDDADKRNPHHMATKFSQFADYGNAPKRARRGVRA